MDQQHAYVELQFCPSPEFVPIVRRFVSTFYEKLLSRADVASRLALASHELLENTVKFSVDRVSSIHLAVTRGDHEIAISIRTRNRASAADSTSANAIVRDIKRATDTFAYYQEVMRSSARRSDGSGLGLARISAEAEMTLDCEIDGDELVLVASAVVPGELLSVTPRIMDPAAASFAATSAFDGRAITLRLAGNADLGVQDQLETLLPRLHSEALRVAAPEVVIDFTRLEFMNSSCFRNFVTWLSDVKDLPPERQYRIRLVANDTILWQRRSLHALRCFADELVTIES
jgi:hypothetical protein